MRWKATFEGFLIRDCTLGCDENRMGFLLIQDLGDTHRENGWQTRFVSVKLDEPMETRFFYMTGNDLTTASLTSAWLPNQAEFVVADLAMKVWSCRPPVFAGGEAPISFDGIGYGYKSIGAVGGVAYKVVRVDDTIYAVGAHFRIFKRLPTQQWKEQKEIPLLPGLSSKEHDKITQAISEGDCYDLSGFSKNDMYAVGGGGTVWHFNGMTWENLPFPTNHRLHTVTCGGDGFVYITDISGSLWKGRNSTWQRISLRSQSLPFADAAWYMGTLWCANDYGMFVLEGSELVAIHQSRKHLAPADIAMVGHRIDVAPDGRKMLVCGAHGAAIHDGTCWKMLFSDDDFID